MGGGGHNAPSPDAKRFDHVLNTSKVSISENT